MPGIFKTKSWENIFLQVYVIVCTSLRLKSAHGSDGAQVPHDTSQILDDTKQVQKYFTVSSYTHVMQAELDFNAAPI